MKTANQSHKERIIDILTEAFDDNPSINYIVKQDSKRKARIRHLMEYCVEVCLATGEIFLSDNEKGCLLIRYPENKLPAFKSLVLDLKLALNSIGLWNIPKVIHREKLIKANQPKLPFYYLWYAGVYPDNQGEGIGSKLMEEVLRHCDKERRPIYLETSVIKNIAWYEKYGFTVCNEIELGYRLFQMMRS